MVAAWETTGEDVGDSIEFSGSMYQRIGSFISWVVSSCLAEISKKQNTNRPISLYMAVILVFLTHGCVNAALLQFSGDKLRCLFWNITTSHCSTDQAWLLNWMPLGQFHVCLLVAGLAVEAMGDAVLEERVAYLVGAIMTSHLSNGIFLLDQLNQPMALLQAVIYVGMLITLAVQVNMASTADENGLVSTINHSTVDCAAVPTTSAETPQGGPSMEASDYGGDNDCYDEYCTIDPDHPNSNLNHHHRFYHRQSVLLFGSTFVMGLLCCISCFQLVEMTLFHGHKNAYIGLISDTSIFQSMSHTIAANLMWVTIILAWSTVLATRRQQQAIFMGHACALLLAQIILNNTSTTTTTSNNNGNSVNNDLERRIIMNPDYSRAACVGNFCTLLIAIMGSY